MTTSKLLFSICIIISMMFAAFTIGVMSARDDTKNAGTFNKISTSLICGILWPAIVVYPKETVAGLTNLLDEADTVLRKMM